MATTIITKFGSGAPAASDVVRGELAVDTENGRLYTENIAGSVVEIGLNPSGNVDVTGTVTADGLTVGDSSSSFTLATIQSSTSGESELRMGDTDTDAGSISYTNSDDTMTFRAAAAARMSLNSTGLDVTGTVTATTALEVSSGVPYIDWTDTATTDEDTRAITFNGDFYIGTINDAKTTTKKRFLIDHSTGDISFYEDTGTTAKFFWDASAESLLLGTDSGDAFNGDALLRMQGATSIYLQMKSSTTGTTGILFGDTDDDYTGGLLYSATDDALVFTTNNGNERLRIDSAGNVGIGTDSPAYITEIAKGQAGGVGPTLYLHNTVDNAATGHAADIRFNLRNDEATSRNAIIRAQAAAGYGSDPNLLFLVSAGSTGTPQEAMRIDSSGRLLINTTSETTPGNSSAYLVVESDSGSSQEGIYIRADGGIGDLPFVIGNASNIAKLNIYGDGDVENTNGTYGTISDARVKENITDAASQWEDFKAIRIRRYNLISKPNEPHIGVIAQELEEAGIGGLVKDTRQDGMKSVKTSILYMKAIKALQEAMERIETLEAKVAQLEGAN